MKVMKRNIVLIVAVVSMAHNAFSQGVDHTFDVAKNLDIFNAIYQNLDMFYVDSLNPQKVIRTGIDAMLQSLDPYTEYFPEEEMEDLNMMTTGKYGGIGSLIRMRKDSTVMIAEPYEGMPAAEVGLQVGDILLKIDSIDLKGKVTSEVSELLRGEPGTSLSLRIQRPGENSPRDFLITRRSIHLPAVTYYGMLKDGSNDGYIDFTQFTENCSVEVLNALLALKQQGAQRIILDLRGNGGGLLDEAVKIVNLFVPRDTTVVEVKGRIEGINHAYKTTSIPLDLDIPVVVLVGHNTASAAEIVAGALQDLGRATIVGVRTFGKGLVQSPRELPWGGSLKFTSSKYYLPSGRCIQEIDYKALRDTEKTEQTEKTEKTEKTGGITPDLVVHHDTLPNLLLYLANDDVLVDYGTHYCQTHKAPSSVTKFSISDKDFEEFKRMIHSSGFTYDRLSEKRFEDLKKMMEFEGYLDDAADEMAALEAKLTHNLDRDLDRHKHDIKRLMTSEIVKRWFYQCGAIEESLQYDEDLAAVKNLGK